MNTGFERCGNCRFLRQAEKVVFFGPFVFGGHLVPPIESQRWRCSIRSTPGPLPERDPEHDWCAEWQGWSPRELEP